MSAGRLLDPGASFLGAKAADCTAEKSVSRIESCRWILSPFPPQPTWWSPYVSAVTWQTGQLTPPLRQCPLSYNIDEVVYNQLLSAAPDTQTSALNLSTSLPRAGDWLNVVPSSTLGLRIQDKEFRLCLQYWLGLQMSNDLLQGCPVRSLCHIG